MIAAVVVLSALLTLALVGLYRALRIQQTWISAILRDVEDILPEPYRSHFEHLLANRPDIGPARTFSIGRDRQARREDRATAPSKVAADENRDGGTWLFAGLIRNLTLRSHRAQALLDSEAKARAILETAVDGIITIDPSGTILSANPAIERLFGYSAGEMMGNNVSMMMPEPHRSSHDGYLQRYLLSGVPRIIGIGREVQGLCKDGSVFPIQLSVGEATVAGARIFTGIVHDLSTRKRAEDALYAEKERAEVMLRSIGDGVLATDERGRVEYLNPVAESLTGWPLTEAAGLPLSDVFKVVDEYSRAPAADPVALCLDENRIVEPDDRCVLISRTGTECAIDDSASPMRDREGRVVGAVLVFHDVSETREMSRQLEHDAGHDALTGLVNRRGFERRLEHALASAHEHGLQHSVCFFDLDHFKLINDTAGHAAGDSVLQQVRGVMVGKFRDRDTLARLGGDEFGLLLENCESRDGVRIAEVIAASFREWRFQWNEQRFRVGVSVGVTTITRATQSVQQAMSEVDVACYTAKERGRGRVYVYHHDGGDPSSSHGQILVAAALAEALEQNRFRLYAQPIVPLHPHCAAGSSRRYEILIRMFDRDDIILLPRAFIPAAERFGLIVSIDRWVVASALQFYAERIDAADCVEISINLSAPSLNTDDMADYVQDQFVQSGVSQERFCFELTETATIYNLDRAKDFIGKIRTRGSRFAIDDFGSGHSSFKYLRALSADYLKIDGSFVENMIDSGRDQALVAAINEVGHSLGIATIAEFAHSVAIVDRLREMNVDYAQGYALGMPVPLEQVL